MKKIIVIMLLLAGINRLHAQNESYRGGVADGHSLITQAVPFGNPLSFQPYFGGSSDGYSSDSLITFVPGGSTLLFAPYQGSIADGYAADSIISFPQYASINMFSPFLGSIADGYASDSSIAFNQHGYITMYQPYAGGIADGWVGYPVFGIIIVPVNLLSFSGQQADHKHLLHWTTTQEQNSSHFEIERSGDGIHFTGIGTKPAAGNSTTQRNYDFTDNIPLNGNNFYRLRIVDADGTGKYSNIILLKLLDNNTTMAIYPNPASKILHITLGGITDNSIVKVSLFNMKGQLIVSSELKKTVPYMNLDVENLPAGIYTVRLTWNNETSVWRFVKQ